MAKKLRSVVNLNRIKGETFCDVYAGSAGFFVGLELERFYDLVADIFDEYKPHKLIPKFKRAILAGKSLTRTQLVKVAKRRSGTLISEYG